MRRKRKVKFTTKPDIRFNSLKVAKLINYVMLDGKKSVAATVVYDAFDKIKEITGNPNPLEVFDLAIKNASPTVEVRSARIGGANYQIPREVRPERRLQLALRWMVLFARKSRKSSGQPMSQVLANEIISASKGEGSAVKKKEDTHRMAEANKAFAHYGW